MKEAPKQTGEEWEENFRVFCESLAFHLGYKARERMEKLKKRVSIEKEISFSDGYVEGMNYGKSLSGELLTSERERVVREIELYFKGLIFIPDPQKTKENLLSKIRVSK